MGDFFYQNVGALLFYIAYRYIKILLSEFNLVYFSASFREKSELVKNSGKKNLGFIASLRV